MEQSLYVGPSIQWLADTHRLGPPDREELKVEARASSVFMSIQALIGTRAYLSKPLFLICPLVLLAFSVVAYHVVHHIRHDRPKTNVLKHPTCRYIPHALPASAFFASPFDSTRFKNEISPTSPLV